MHDVTLSRSTRQFIVLLALVQGLLLWLAEQGRLHDWWLLSELGGRVCWYTLVLGLPSCLMLSVRELSDRRFWQHAVLVLIVLSTLAAWAVWSVGGAPGSLSSSVLGPYGFTVSLALFIALPWVQGRLQHGHWRVPYADLFEAAWQNTLTGLLTLLFVGICWIVLTLWAALFELIKIDFFKELFDNDPFQYMATGLMVGFGILIGRTQQHAVRVARNIVLAIFTGLLPILAAVALLFALSLPFTGLDTLWGTRSAASILLMLVAAIIAFTNAVYQDGQREAAYPSWLRRLVDAGLVTLPIHAGLGAYALYLRIDQHGWSVDRYWAMLAAAVLMAYALGYAHAVLRARQPWLGGLARVNRMLSLVIVVLIIASNSFVLDPYRLAVASQLARWQQGRIAVDALDLEYLRFESGRRGYEAALALREDGKLKADASLAARLEKVLARMTRYEGMSEDELRSNAVTTQADLAKLLVPAPNMPAPPPALLDALLKRRIEHALCRQPDEDCVYIARDLDGDASMDALICNLDRSGWPRCEIWAQADATWKLASEVEWSCCWQNSELKSALRKGELSLERKRWPDLIIAGKRASPGDVYR